MQQATIWCNVLVGTPIEKEGDGSGSMVLGGEYRKFMKIQKLECHLYIYI